MKRVDIYNLNNGTISWSHEGKPFYSWCQTGYAVHKGDLYIGGGHSYYGIKAGYQRHVIKKVMRYKVLEDRWDFVPELPRASNGPLLFVLHNKLHVIPGEDKEVQRLDLKYGYQQFVDNWSVMNSATSGLLYDKSGPNTVAQVGDMIYAIGKRNDYSVSVMSWDGYGKDIGGWVKQPNMNVARHEFYTCLSTDSERYLWAIGGCKNCLDGGFIERFDTVLNTWVKVDSLPNLEYLHKKSNPTFVTHACGFSQGFIYAIFSETDKSGLGHQFHIFDTVNNKWTASDTNIKEGAYFPVAAVV